MLRTFSHNEAGPSTGIVFLANPGEAPEFVFSCGLELTAAVPGTASLIDPLGVELGLFSASGIGSSSVQLSTSGVQGFCLAITLIPSDTCNLPVVAGNPLTPGNICQPFGKQR